MRRHAVRFRGLAIAPEFNDREVVLAVGLDHGLKAQVAVVLASVLGKLFGESRAVLTLGRNDIDMRHGSDGRPARFGCKRCNRQWEMGALIDGRILDGFDLLAKFSCRRCLAMALGARLILPCLKEYELVWQADALQGLCTQIARLPLGGFAKLAHQLFGLRRLSRHDFEVGDNVAGTFRDWRRSSRRLCQS